MKNANFVGEKEDISELVESLVRTVILIDKHKTKTIFEDSMIAMAA